jgi:hypothetical protein
MSTWKLDWFSSAVTFPGWAEYGDAAFLWRGPPTYDPLFRTPAQDLATPRGVEAFTMRLHFSVRSTGTSVATVWARHWGPRARAGSVRPKLRLSEPLQLDHQLGVDAEPRGLIAAVVRLVSGDDAASDPASEYLGGYTEPPGALVIEPLRDLPVIESLVAVQQLAPVHLYARTGYDAARAVRRVAVGVTWLAFSVARTTLVSGVPAMSMGRGAQARKFVITLDLTRSSTSDDG